MKDEVAKKVNISKTALDGTTELRGAELSIVDEENHPVKDASNKVIAPWISEGKAKEFTLKEGTYKLIENQAPIGYLVAEEITFRVTKYADIEIKQADGSWKTPSESKVVMKDAPKESFYISKTTLDGTKELAGALLHLEDSQGARVGESWLSDGKAKAFTLDNGTYTLVEDQAPTGYAVAERITFSVEYDKKGKVTVKVKQADNTFKEVADSTVVMKDDVAVNVNISKTLLDGTTELAGAELKLVDASDTNTPKKLATDATNMVIQPWISGGDAKVLTLRAGTYTLIENQAPLGFSKAADITFRVNPDASVEIEQSEGVWVPTVASTIVMKDDVSKEVNISKTTLDGTVELSGAELTLSKLGGKELATWISEGKAKTFSLDAGTYLLKENQAPLGYDIAEDIVFRVNQDASVEVQQLDGSFQPVEHSTVVMKDALLPDAPIGNMRTTVSVNGIASGEKPASLLATDKINVQDTIHYAGLMPNTEYQVTGTLMNVTNDQEVAKVNLPNFNNPVTATFTTDSSGSGDWVIDFGTINNLPAGTYVVYEHAETTKEYNFRDGTKKHEVDHKNPNDQAQTFVVSEKPKPSANTGKLRTTVSVDNQKSDETTSVNVIASSKLAVIDTVDYQDLVPNQNYQLTGTLMKIENGVATPIAGPITTQFNSGGTGTGQTTINFGELSNLTPGKYVVYEKAVSLNVISFVEGDKQHEVKHENPDDAAQTFIVTPKETPTAGNLRTTVAVNGQASSENLSRHVSKQDQLQVVDTVVYENLTPNQNYRLTGTLMRIENGVATSVQLDGFTNPKSMNFTADASGKGTVKLDFGTLKNLPAGTYVVYEEAQSIPEKEGDEPTTFEHKNPNDRAQTFVVTPPSKNFGSLRTTVTVDNQTSTDTQSVTSLKAANHSIKDTVYFNNLVPNQTYTLTGTLMKIENGTATPVQLPGFTNPVQTTFNTGTTGTGQTILDFGNVANLPVGTYVVYEKAQSQQSFEFVEGKQPHVVTHENPNDRAQTFVVTQPNIPVVKEGSLKTTVNAGGQLSSAQHIAQIDYNAQGILVTDLVTYTNLRANTTYVLYGMLMDVTKETAVVVATANRTFTTTATGNSDQAVALSFGKVKVLPGHKYVVFESAGLMSEEPKITDNGNFNQDTGKQIIFSGYAKVTEHKDRNDQAQTFVVKEVPTTDKPKLPNTGQEKPQGQKKEVKQLPKTGYETSNYSMLGLSLITLVAGFGLVKRMLRKNQD